MSERLRKVQLRALLDRAYADQADERARAAQLAAALRLFTGHGDDNDRWPDSELLFWRVELGDVRQARIALDADARIAGERWRAMERVCKAAMEYSKVCGAGAQDMAKTMAERKWRKELQDALDRLAGVGGDVKGNGRVPNQDDYWGDERYGHWETVWVGGHPDMGRFPARQDVPRDVWVWDRKPWLTGEGGDA